MIHACRLGSLHAAAAMVDMIGCFIRGEGKHSPLLRCLFSCLDCLASSSQSLVQSSRDHECADTALAAHLLQPDVLELGLTSNQEVVQSVALSFVCKTLVIFPRMPVSMQNWTIYFLFDKFCHLFCLGWLAHSCFRARIYFCCGCVLGRLSAPDLLQLLHSSSELQSLVTSLVLQDQMTGISLSGEGKPRESDEVCPGKEECVTLPLEEGKKENNIGLTHVLRCWTLCPMLPGWMVREILERMRILCFYCSTWKTCASPPPVHYLVVRGSLSFHPS